MISMFPVTAVAGKQGDILLTTDDIGGLDAYVTAHASAPDLSTYAKLDGSRSFTGPVIAPSGSFADVRVGNSSTQNHPGIWLDQSSFTDDTAVLSYDGNTTIIKSLGGQMNLRLGLWDRIYITDSAVNVIETLNVSSPAFFSEGLTVEGDFPIVAGRAILTATNATSTPLTLAGAPGQAAPQMVATNFSIDPTGRVTAFSLTAGYGIHATAFPVYSAAGYINEGAVPTTLWNYGGNPTIIGDSALIFGDPTGNAVVLAQDVTVRAGKILSFGAGSALYPNDVIGTGKVSSSGGYWLLDSKDINLFGGYATPTDNTSIRWSSVGHGVGGPSFDLEVFPDVNHNLVVGDGSTGNRRVISGGLDLTTTGGQTAPQLSATGFSVGAAGAVTTTSLASSGTLPITAAADITIDAGAGVLNLISRLVPRAGIVGYNGNEYGFATPGNVGNSSSLKSLSPGVVTVTDGFGGYGALVAGAGTFNGSVTLTDGSSVASLVEATPYLILNVPSGNYLNVVGGSGAIFQQRIYSDGGLSVRFGATADFSGRLSFGPAGRLSLPSYSAAPSNPVAGEVYWDSVLTAAYLYDGANQQRIFTDNGNNTLEFDSASSITTDGSGNLTFTATSITGLPAPSLSGNAIGPINMMGYNLNMKDSTGLGGGNINMDGGTIKGVGLSFDGTDNTQSIDFRNAERINLNTIALNMNNGSGSGAEGIIFSMDGGNIAKVNVIGGVDIDGTGTPVLNIGDNISAIRFRGSTVSMNDGSGSGATALNLDSAVLAFTTTSNITPSGSSLTVNFGASIFTFDDAAGVQTPAAISASSFSIFGGGNGFTGSGQFTNFTIEGGIITGAS